MYQEQIERVLKGIILLGAFLVPCVALVFSSDFFFPYITPKNFAFRILTEVMFIAWIGLAFLNVEFRIRRSPIVLAGAAFIGIMALATAFSVEPLRSFWSVFERMEGYITLLHLGAYFIALTSVIRKENLWRYLFYCMLGVSVIVGVGGLMELSETNRVAGLLGNAAYLGTYAMVHAGLALLLTVRPGIHRIERYLYAALAFFNIWVMYNTATRGAMLGFLAGSFIAALVYVLYARARQEKRFRIVAGSIIALLIVLGGIFFAVKDSSWVTENRVLRRFASISLEDKTTRSRLLLWDLAVDGWKERPVLGWGQENFDYVFLSHYNPRLHDQEPFFDRAHNIFLDWLIAGGILGLLGYLSLYIALVYLIWKSGISIGEKSVLTGLVAGYGVQNFFVFDTLMSYLFFVTLLAYVHTMSPYGNGKQKRFFSGVPKTYAPGILVCVCIAACVLPWSINASGGATARDIITGLYLTTTSDVSGIADVFTRAQSHGYLGRFEARAHMARAAGIVNGRDDVSEEEKLALYTETKVAMEHMCAEQPKNARAFFMAGMFFTGFREYDTAITYFEKAIVLAPMKDQFIRTLALVYAQQGRYDTALEAIASVYHTNPRDNDALSSYLQILIQADRIDEARAVYAEAPETAFLPSPSLLRKLVKAQMREEALAVLDDVMIQAEKMFEVSPEMYFLKASLYMQLGMLDDAHAVLLEAINLFPEAEEQARVYLEQLTQ